MTEAVDKIFIIVLCDIRFMLLILFIYSLQLGLRVGCRLEALFLSVFVLSDCSLTADGCLCMGYMQVMIRIGNGDQN